jgi:hypothetical protein
MAQIQTKLRGMVPLSFYKYQSVIQCNTDHRMDTVVQKKMKTAYINQNAYDTIQTEGNYYRTDYS